MIPVMFREREETGFSYFRWFETIVSEIDLSKNLLTGEGVDSNRCGEWKSETFVSTRRSWRRAKHRWLSTYRWRNSSKVKLTGQSGCPAAVIESGSSVGLIHLGEWQMHFHWPERSRIHGVIAPVYLEILRASSNESRAANFVSAGSTETLTLAFVGWRASTGGRRSQCPRRSNRP